MYSRFLVFVQFLMIFAIFVPKESRELTPFWWILPLISLVTALWIFTHNRVGNFNIVPDIKDGAKLIVTGPYRFVRHPMYSSLILFMLGILLWHFSWLNLLFFFIMSVAVLLKAFKEEKLWHIEDEKYASYMKNTKMIIPFVV
jgi:protein-S-isoprenylcysteine O-methyltransferase Ste14